MDTDIVASKKPVRIKEEKPFDERTLQIDRVARVVKGGRRFRFRALVVVGDKKHSVGVGSAKGPDVTAAVTKATSVAKKNMVKVPIVNQTIPHEIETKISGAKIFLKPASKGTGLIAGGVIRTILEVAGVSNILSKSLGSSNKTNIAYATIKALTEITKKETWTTSLNNKSSKEKQIGKKNEN